MNSLRYILRSLGHFRFTCLGVLAGAGLGAMVLLGALFAGDSVEASLRQIGQQRIGQATHILAAGDRFFRQALAEDLAAAGRVRTAPVIYARGTTSHAANRLAANQVQLVGVTDAFWKFAPTPAALSLQGLGSPIAVNDALARRLNVAIGDTLIVRLYKPGILAGNAPVAGAEARLQSFRGTVTAIVGDASFGRFTLDATQVAVPSVFLPIERLQESLDRPGRANLLLIDATGSTADLPRALRSVLRLADYGLTLKWRERAAAFEVASDRIFIAPELAQAVSGAVPGTQAVLSYLVNEFRGRDRTTPYSIATATTREAAPFLPADLGAGEIVLNSWLAEDLQATAGDEVKLTYFQVGDGGALVERSTPFRVRAVVPLEGLAADDAWMPEFPGITDTNGPRDWDPGLPLVLDRVRDKDERYWDDFRGAPKAFLSLAGGREIWSTRWGNQTALRVPGARGRESELTGILLGALQPEMNQLTLRNLRAQAQEAAQSAVDFGGLFLGMSFFLILAALGLVAMLFQLSLLQRNREDALLGAVGLDPRRVLRWRMGEGLVILLAGCVIGLPLAVLYTRGILRLLGSIWSSSAGTSTFVFAAQPASMVAGAAAFLFFSLLAIWVVIRKQTRQALSIRLAAHTEETSAPAKIRRTSRVVASITAAMGAGAIGFSGRGLPAPAAFYLAGFFLLIAGIAACRAWLAGTPDFERGTRFDAGHLGGLNLKARRSRNLAVVGMIATAVFMVLSVASFRKQVGADWLERDSGTGGFAFWLETTAPQNLARDGKAQGFEIFERHAADLGGIVPLRMGVGDNVNCFNLNTTAQPQILAVDAAQLAARNAFPLRMGGPAANLSGWTRLRTAGADGAIPALMDATTLQWALKRKIGDVIAYADENGRSFNVRIVGTLPDSIFQGYLLMDEHLFLEKFPSHPGYAIFLLDAKNRLDLPALRDRLGAGLADVGGRIELTRDVLAAFHRIENTYIAIFNVLGALGVLLGSLGLAIVVARNLRERRGEFAMMMAFGIPRDVLARMIFSEFGRLVLWGVAIGAVASAIAVWPNLATFPAAPTLALAAGLLGGIVVLNLASGWAIFRWSLRDLRPSLAL